VKSQPADASGAGRGRGRAGRADLAGEPPQASAPGSVSCSANTLAHCGGAHGTLATLSAVAARPVSSLSRADVVPYVVRNGVAEGGFRYMVQPSAQLLLLVEAV
jgi:hypothetical protein